MPPLDAIDSNDADALALYFAKLAVAAGAAPMEILTRPTLEARYKNDKSPVTEADERVEAFLLSELARDLPDIPAIAEETAAKGEMATHGDAFFLIDPIDGTREFLERGADFTINLALIRGSAPFAGAVYAPALNRVWFAGATAYEAQAAPGGALPGRDQWKKLRARARPGQGLTALVSKSHLDPRTQEFLSTHSIRERIPRASSLKFCLLANGEADVYPRFGPTMEWDTAAGDAILRAAGGATLDPQGRPLLYGKSAQDYRNGAFICWAQAR